MHADSCLSHLAHPATVHNSYIHFLVTLEELEIICIPIETYCCVSFRGACHGLQTALHRGIGKLEDPPPSRTDTAIIISPLQAISRSKVALLVLTRDTPSWPAWTGRKRNPTTEMRLSRTLEAGWTQPMKGMCAAVAGLNRKEFPPHKS